MSCPVQPKFLADARDAGNEKWDDPVKGDVL